MINVAIVDDDEIIYNQLNEYLLRFSNETGVLFNVSWYPDALDFLEGYKSVDIVLMDVVMPHVNGITAAERLRKIDKDVALIFITNMVKYAIKGYSVNALDYVLKPINYARFSALLKKTIRVVGENTDVQISIKTTGGVTKLYASSIIYIGINDHLLVYNTETDRVLAWGSLKEAQKQLPDTFVRCNHGTIVNLKHVETVDGNTIYLANDRGTLQISHNKRKEFMAQLSKYMGLR